MNKMNKLASVGLVIAILLGVYSSFFRTHKQDVQYVGGSGPYQGVDFFSFPGGFEPTWRTDDMQTSTSTLCAIPFPSATSTLESVFVNLTSQDSTGGTLVIATSTTAFSTTTKLFTSNSFVWQPVTWYATSTDATGQNTYLKPNAGYVVVDVSGQTSYDYRGKCYAKFNVFR